MKMIKKKMIALILGGLIAGSAIIPLSACLPSLPKKENDDKENLTPLPEWEQNVTLTSDGALVEWEEVEGAAAYKVYHSPSRFATYTLESTQTDLYYFNTDKYGYYRVEGIGDNGEVLDSQLYSYEIDTFGENTHIYADTDDRQAIQDDVYEFYLNTDQFSELRYAGLFKKGIYNELDLIMSYYMTLAGLGELPTDVEIGRFNTYGELAGGNSTCNFWRGIENMTVNSDVQWAVSQATSFRRMQVNGDLTLHDTRPDSTTPWASGGFIADTNVKGKIDGSVQQQWFTRNSNWESWSGGDINTVFAGCTGTLSNYNWGSYGNGWVTYLDTTKVIAEKPYLTFDSAGYCVCVPEVRKEAKGLTWPNNAHNEDWYIPFGSFYVARADRDNSQTLNAALKNGKHILLTPGIYDIDSPLLVEKNDTVIMGLGLASLRITEENEDTIMRVSDVDGVRISGIIFDAGPQSKTLLQIGEEKTDVRHSENPVILNDVYFRIGGAGSAPTSVDVTLEINCNDVVGDNFWVWRADHGNRGTVGWDTNRTKNGVIVNGDYVSIFGLMVEHFHEYQTIWNGEYGYMVFYQSETPYDVEMEYEEVPAPTDRNPNATAKVYTTQERWMSEWNGERYLGWASYKVGDGVQNHEAYGLGVYYVASGGKTFTLDHAIEAPANTGIKIEHMGIANFLTYGDGETNGGILHIINGEGKPLFTTDRKNHFRSYVAGVYTEN